MPEPLPVRSAWSRFVTAAAAPWRGLAFLARTPAAWPFAAVTALIATVLIVGLGALSLHFVPRQAVALLPPGSSWYLTAGRWVTEVVATLSAVLLSVVVGAGLAQPLAGPALERLVRLREQEMGLPPRPPTSFWLDLWRSTRSALIGSLSLPLIVLLWLVGLLVPGAALVVVPLKFLVVGIFVSWDLLDYPLSIRGLGIRQRLRWMGSHKPEVLGFGVSLALVFVIPCMQLLLLPAGVVGAATLVARDET